MSPENKILNRKCPNCGAELGQNGICTYCADPLILIERDIQCRDFLLTLNSELEHFPPALSWLMLFIWLGLPLGVVFSAVAARASGFYVLVWTLMVLFALLFSTIIAGGIGGAHRRKKFKEELNPIIKSFLLQNKMSYDDLQKKARETLPRKAILIKMLREDRNPVNFVS